MRDEYSALPLEVLRILHDEDGGEEFIVRVEVVKSAMMKLLLAWLTAVETEVLKRGYLDFTRRDMVFVIDC